MNRDAGTYRDLPMNDEPLVQLLDQLIASLPGGRLTALGILVVLYLTRYYWLAPILFLSKPPIPPSKVEPALPEHSIPEPARRHFAEQAAALGKLGFVATPLIREHNGTGNAMFHQIHRHPVSGDVAGVGVFVAGTDPTPKSRTLGFMARLADGTEIQTLTDTVGLRGAPRERGRRIVFWIGDGVKYTATPDDLDLLYRVHRALVRRTGGTQRPIPLEDPVSHQTRVAAAWRQRMIASGWYRNDGTGGIRPTLVGGCLSMWLQLWPWRAIRRWREHRTVKELMVEWMKNPDTGSLAA
jgi:hypothetical protein